MAEGGLKEKILESINFHAFYSGELNSPLKDGEEVQAHCPFHDDQHPSLSINLTTGLWHCHACGEGGDVFKFYMKKHSLSFKDALKEMAEKAGIRPQASGIMEADKPKKKGKRPPLDPSLADKFHKNLNDAAYAFLAEKRGLSRETIDRYKIGWNGNSKRFTIPIYDENGRLVNIKSWSPSPVNSEDKYISWRTREGHTYGEGRIYGADEIKDHDKVILCEGEFDRLVAIQNGFFAVTGTVGAKSFKAEWIPLFTGKEVFIVYDRDRDGEEGALKAAKALAPVAKSVRIATLPDEVGEKGDITDFFVRCHQTREDFQKLLDKAGPFELKKDPLPLPDPLKLASFIEIEKKEMVDKRVEVDLTVCGETSETFHAPTKFLIDFCRKRDKKGTCFDCPKGVEMVLNPGDETFIGCCMSSEEQVKKMLTKKVCKEGENPVIKITEKTTVKEFFAHQKIKRFTHTVDEDGNLIELLDGAKQELMEKRIYYITDSIVRPKSYRATGFIKTHPKTSQVTFLIDEMQPLEDEFETFSLTEETQGLLRRFQSLSVEEIVQDLSAHVTKVVHRDDILLGILLTFCSPLHLYFQGDLIRGWLTTCILGDSGQAKTQSYLKLVQFLGFGDLFSGLSGSRTGLIYGLSEHKQKGWQIRIGRYPANTRKILSVDEAQKLDKDEIETLGKAMDEGFLQVDRISSGGYETKTRLICMGNPKGSRIMDEYMFPCQALEYIFPTMMIRRFDLCLFASASDIPDREFINRKVTSPSEPRISSEMFKAVVFWAWNLKAENIDIPEDVTEFILTEATRLSDKFGEAADIPIVSPSDFRHTLARLSAAFAVLDGSTSDGFFTKVIVKKEHVRFVSHFLEVIYGAENCRLDEYSDIQRQRSQLSDYEEIKKALEEAVEEEKHGEDENNQGKLEFIIRLLRFNGRMKRSDLAEIVDLAKDSISRKLSLLRRYHLVDSDIKGCFLTPKASKFISRLIKDPNTTMDISDRQVSKKKQELHVHKTQEEQSEKPATDDKF